MDEKQLYFKNKYRVPSTRLAGWDYASEGYYFITICTQNKENYFGEIKNEKMNLFDVGNIAEKFWLEIPAHFKNIKLDEFVIMPNHLHGIIIIENDSKEIHLELKNKRKFGPLQKNSIPLVINQFKRIVKIYCNENDLDFTWQPRYCDHIIKDGEELNGIRQYILDNPLKWDLDRNNPKYIP
jgi:putative transposase